MQSDNCCYLVLNKCYEFVLLLSEEWATYLRYVRSLDFFETPDYNYLYKMFMGVMERHGWPCDWVFDWTDKHKVCHL